MQLASLLCGCDAVDDGAKEARAAASTSASPAGTGEDATCTQVADKDGDGFFVLSGEFCGNFAPVLGPEEMDCDDTDPVQHVSVERYADKDGDGFGDAAQVQSACEDDMSPGLVSNSRDCNDADPLAFERVYLDEDNDGYGAGQVQCGRMRAGWVTVSGDCDDAEFATHPRTEEDVSYDGIDRDCDGHDIPSWREDAAREPLVWSQGALCPGAVVAVLGIEGGARVPCGSYLHVGAVGTRDTSDVRLIVRDTSTLNPRPTEVIELPQLAPGQIFRTDRVAVGGVFEATFEYGTTALDAAGIVEKGEQGDAATAVGDAGDASPGDVDRCLLAQMPVVFTSSLCEL